MQFKCTFKPEAHRNNRNCSEMYWSKKKTLVTSAAAAALTVSYKTQKGPNLSVEGLRRGSGKSLLVLGGTECYLQLRRPSSLK